MSVLWNPTILWDLYVEYLWNYEPGSWVASTASTFRVLAVLLISPFIVLTLLDVASYVIARTLGVIDDTKASTGERPTPPSDTTPRPSSTAEGNVPAIRVTPYDEPAPEPPSMGIEEEEEEGNLRLSGVDMFSPAPSQPPSPTLSRRDLHGHVIHQIREEQGIEPSVKGARARAHTGSSQSSSGESSFAMLERESGSEDTDGLQMRKRVPRAGERDDS